MTDRSEYEQLSQDFHMVVHCLFGIEDNSSKNEKVPEFWATIFGETLW